jgi:membrane protease YdiL (CAAX protease family)
VLGTVLCLVYWKTNSLLPCIVLHAINNCIALSSALKWDWQVPVLMVGALMAISAILLPVVHRGRRVEVLV